MTSLLEARRAAIAIAKVEGPKKQIVLEEKAQTNSLVLNLAQHLKTMEEFELEISPRDTVYRLLSEKKLGEQFIFKVALGTGIRYVQAMRMVLTRTRERARNKKRVLDEFKLYCLNITSVETHDIVTLVRSNNMTEQEASLYDSLVEMAAKK